MEGARGIGVSVFVQKYPASIRQGEVSYCRGGRRCRLYRGGQRPHRCSSGGELGRVLRVRLPVGLRVVLRVLGNDSWMGKKLADLRMS